MRAWLASVAVTAIAIHLIASSEAFENLKRRPVQQAAGYLDRAALLLMGSSPTRRDRLGSVEKIADLRPDDPLRRRAATTALLAVERKSAAGKRSMHYCTTVLVSAETLITNEHCVRGNEATGLASADVWFNYIGPSTADVYPIKEIISGDAKLDYAVLRIDLPVDHPARAQLAPLKWRKAVPGERAFVVHHGGGDVQQISRAFCRIEIEQPSDATVLAHTCPITGGASGSLIVAESDFAVLGLVNSYSTKPDSVRAYATPFGVIVAHAPMLVAKQ